MDNYDNHILHNIPTEPGIYLARSNSWDKKYTYIILISGEKPFLRIKCWQPELAATQYPAGCVNMIRDIKKFYYSDKIMDIKDFNVDPNLITRIIN